MTSQERRRHHINVLIAEFESDLNVESSNSGLKHAYKRSFYLSGRRQISNSDSTFRFKSVQKSEQRQIVTDASETSSAEWRQRHRQRRRNVLFQKQLEKKLLPFPVTLDQSAPARVRGLSMLCLQPLPGRQYLTSLSSEQACPCHYLQPLCSLILLSLVTLRTSPSIRTDMVSPPPLLIRTFKAAAPCLVQVLLEHQQHNMEQGWPVYFT